MTELIRRPSKIKMILLHYKPYELTGETTPNKSKFSTYSSARNNKNVFSNSRLTDFTDKSSEEKSIEIVLSLTEDSNRQLRDPLKIIDLKQIISEKFEIKMDQLILYTFNQNPVKINDNEKLDQYLLEPENNPAAQKIFYYSISNANSKINLNIEYHLNNISTISLELNSNCSIYLLKYLIFKNIEGNIPITEQTLKILGITQNTSNEPISRTESKIIDPIYNTNRSLADNDKEKGSTSSKSRNLNFYNTYLEKEFNDHKTLSDIIKNFVQCENPSLSKSELPTIDTTQENSRRNNIEQGYLINLLLFRKSGKKITMGIDFSFNILKNLKKIPFYPKAPSYCEASDGLNIFFNCKNTKCKIFDEIFVRNFGLGRFNILIEINTVKCVKCHSKNITAINLGFAYCNWKYSGIVTNKKNSYISGDGLTIDDSMYIMKEVNIATCFARLEIRVKEIEKKINSVLSYESDIALGDIVIPIKKNFTINEKNDERIKSFKANNKVPTLVFKESDNKISRLTQNKYEIVYRKKENIDENWCEKKDKDCELLKPRIIENNVEIKDHKFMSSSELINEKLDMDNHEIKYDHKKHNECCVSDLLHVQNLKNKCIIF